MSESLAMTWRQIAFTFYGPRDDKGYPIPDGGKVYDPKKAFFHHCYLNGVTDSVKREKLWMKMNEPGPVASSDNADGGASGEFASSGIAASS